MEELRFLVGMDRDLLVEQPAEDLVAFLELPPVAFRTVGLRMDQRILPAHEIELAAWWAACIRFITSGKRLAMSSSEWAAHS